MEKFCLKWNDFQANVTSSFRKLRTADDFYDVTLVSDDQKQATAHKIVLSASSEYFKNILKSNKHSHPMICLAGVNSDEMNSILDYIYNGEVQIYQENLDKFLDVAQRFHIEGLMQTEEEVEEKEVKGESKLVETQQEDISFNVKKNEMKEKVMTLTSVNYNNIEELDCNLEETFVKQPDGKYHCNPCGRISRDKTNAKEHAEVHVDGLSFRCQSCDKTFRSRHAYRMHTHRNHKNK